MMSANELADLRAEVERLREWRKSLLDEGFGYDDSEESAAEVLEWAPIWRAQSVGDEYRAEKAEAERDALQRQIDAVRALHTLVDSTAGGQRLKHAVCAEDAARMPCPTIAALDAVEPADQPTVPVVTDDPDGFFTPVSDGEVWTQDEVDAIQRRASERFERMESLVEPADLSDSVGTNAEAGGRRSAVAPHTRGGRAMRRLLAIAAALVIAGALTGCDGNTDPRKGRVTIEDSDCLAGTCTYSWKVCIGPDLYTHTDLGARNGRAVYDERRDVDSPECTKAGS